MGYHHRRARAVRFGESAPLGKRDLQRPALATNDRAIRVRLIELVEQTPTAGASTAAGSKIVTGRTGLRYRPGSDEGVLGQDLLAEIEQQINGRTRARPVDAGLNG